MRIIYVVLIGLIYSTISQVAAQGPNSDPFAYCRTVKNSGLNPTGGMDAPRVHQSCNEGVAYNVALYGRRCLRLRN